MTEMEIRARYPASFPKFDDEQFGIIQEYGERKSYQRGEIIIPLGTKNANVAVVLSGKVNIVNYSSGKAATLLTYGTREMTGDALTVSGRATYIEVVAETDALVLEISPGRLRNLIDENPALASILFAAFISRTQAARENKISPIQVIGSRFSTDTFRIRDFLSKNAASYTWVDIETEPHLEELLKHWNIRETDIPVITCPQGGVLKNPSNHELAEHLGLVGTIRPEQYDLVIVGAGPSGLAAAVSAASEGLNTLVLERKAAGGQAGTSSRIENYPGFPSGLSGEELASRMFLQAQKFGAQISTPCEALKIQFENGYPILTIEDNSQVSAKCLILASGVSYRRLNVPGIEQYEGLGIYYAATPMEAELCKGSEVVIVGGANSAGQAAVFLSEHAAKIYLLLRGKDIQKDMSRYLSRRIESIKNIEVLTEAEIVSVKGNGHLQALDIENRGNGQKREIETSAVFTFIGATPHTDAVPNEIEKDEKGFIKTGTSVEGSPQWSLNRKPFYLETSKPGVFAVGDVRSGSTKRVGSAVGEGTMAIAFVHEFLKSN